MVVCRHYPGYRGPRCTTKVGHRCASEMRIICPLLNSDMSPIMSCALQYFAMHIAIIMLCNNNALLIQPSHSALTGRMCNQRSLATRLRKYSHVSSNIILDSVSVSLSNPFTLNSVSLMYKLIINTIFKPLSVMLILC